MCSVPPGGLFVVLTTVRTTCHYVFFGLELIFTAAGGAQNVTPDTIGSH